MTDQPENLDDAAPEVDLPPNRLEGVLIGNLASELDAKAFDDLPLAHCCTLAFTLNALA